MKNLTIALIALLGIGSTGCISYVNKDAFPKAVHKIVLEENDFQIDKTNLRSSNECFYLFGVIPLGDTDILSRCVTDVRTQAQMDNKAAQLVNVTRDDVLANFIVVTKRQITVTADSIVYTK